MLPLDIKEDDFPQISEIWRNGPYQLEVVVEQPEESHRSREIKVTARENIRTGAIPRFYAIYEEKIRVNDADGNTREVWASTRYPWETGDTAEACLRGALRWIDEEAAKKPAS
jgi:hypothetical protein